jgi:hypothetical protein
MNMSITTTLNKGRSDLSPFLIGEGLRELIVETATVLLSFTINFRC